MFSLFTGMSPSLAKTVKLRVKMCSCNWWKRMITISLTVKLKVKLIRHLAELVVSEIRGMLATVSCFCSQVAKSGFSGLFQRLSHNRATEVRVSAVYNAFSV